MGGAEPPRVTFAARAVGRTDRPQHDARNLPQVRQMLPFRKIARADYGHAQFVSRAILSVQLRRDGYFSDCGLRICMCVMARYSILDLQSAIRHPYSATKSGIAQHDAQAVRRGIKDGLIRLSRRCEREFVRD